MQHRSYLKVQNHPHAQYEFMVSACSHSEELITLLFPPDLI